MGVLSDDQSARQRAALTGGAASALNPPAAVDPATPPASPVSPAAVAEPGFLLFRCAGVDCAAPLSALRAVLPRCPAVLPLPHSPDWLLGVFAQRAELVGLADPAPLLFGVASDRPSTGMYSAALLAGTGERVLAWAVESIGATAPHSPAIDGTDGGPPDDAGAPDAANAAGGAAAYVAGVLAPEPGRHCIVIDVEALLAEMLRALEERPVEQ